MMHVNEPNFPFYLIVRIITRTFVKLDDEGRKRASNLACIIFLLTKFEM